MNLADTFAVLKPDLKVEPIEVTPTIYEDLGKNFDGFKGHVLISIFEFDCDWPAWERHPAGDETVVLLSGSATMKLKEAGGEKIVELKKAGDYLVVPRNTWHTAHVAEPARMLFVTPGEGTENRTDV